MARKSTGPLDFGPNPQKRAKTVVPNNNMNGEKTIPASQRLKGLTGGSAWVAKAGRGKGTYGPGASKKK